MLWFRSNAENEIRVWVDLTVTSVMWLRTCIATITSNCKSASLSVVCVPSRLQWCVTQNAGVIDQDRHGPLTRYITLRVAHAPGMPGTFSPPPRISDPNMHYGTYATRALMPAGTANKPFPFNSVAGNFPGACATRNCAYLVRGPG